MQRIGLIADDLTGAMDSGLALGKRGLETLVSTSWERLPRAEVVVVDTATREAGATTAYARVRQVAAALRGSGADAPRLFKKVDSTMRGNVGYELRALGDALGPRAIVVAPAFPKGGRTTRGGVQRVDGRPLELTAFARDPRWPMRESHLPTLLMQQAGREVGQVGLEDVSLGAEAVAEALQSAREGIIVADAETDAHLAAIAGALARLGEAYVPCGSAGLAEAWADALGLGREGAEGPPTEDAGPVLVVAGSRNDVTAAQLRLAMGERGLPCVEPDPNNWWDPEGEIRRLAAACREALGAGRDVVLTATFLPLQAGRGEAIAGLLGRATAEALRGARAGGLFITGGEIAVAATRALGAEALRIRHEVQPGVPGGSLVGGRWDGLRIVTKAGGFGNPRALLEALDYLHGVL